MARCLTHPRRSPGLGCPSCHSWCGSPYHSNAFMFLLLTLGVMRDLLFFVILIFSIPILFLKFSHSHCWFSIFWRSKTSSYDCYFLRLKKRSRKLASDIIVRMCVLTRGSRKPRAGFSSVNEPNPLLLNRTELFGNTKIQIDPELTIKR